MKKRVQRRNPRCWAVAVSRRQTARTLRLGAPDTWQRTAVPSESRRMILRQLLLYASRYVRYHLRFLANQRAAIM
jgi:hypothetical protein